MPRLLTDEEKIARGTLDARTSEAGRAKREAAKVFQFPVLKKIPDPTFPLDETGQKAYDFWGKRLMEAGLLTQLSLGFIENLAMIEDAIATARQKGNPPAFKLLDERRKNLLWLESLNVDQSVIAGEAKKGAFTSHGFPARLRTSAEHMARRTGTE